MCENETRVGHTLKNECDVYIGRNDNQNGFGTVPVGEYGWLGNPFPEGEYGRQECIERFEIAFVAALEANPQLQEEVAALSGKTLGCWCQDVDADGPACHGEIIKKYADKLAARDS